MQPQTELVSDTVVIQPPANPTPEPRFPIMLLLDTSGSMGGKRIQQLNAGIATFKQEVLQGPIASLCVEVAIITFAPVKMIQDFVTIDQFHPPYLQAAGDTPMGQAIQMGLNQVESRKVIYRNAGIPYYRPWIVLITDGAPTDSWQDAAQRVRQGAASEICFFTIGVEGADMNILEQIAPPSTPPVMLDGLKFQEFFRWLAESVKISVSSSSEMNSKQVALPSISGWVRVDLPPSVCPPLLER